jgi:ferritin-like metal-binding protein YciE
MPGIDSLGSLFEDELKDIYDAEKQITKALPKMIKKAGADELRSAFEEHLQQTEQQIERLEQVFELLELPARGKKCVGMQNLIKEGQEMMSEAEDDDTRDALMIAAAQKIEHYEIASYGTLRVWANLLGHEDAASLLEETLDEEKETDQRLTTIAESFVNQAAADEEEEEEERPKARSAARKGRGGAMGRQQAADRGGARGRGRGR